MGLDMTLERRIHIYGMYPFYGTSGEINIYKDERKIDIPFNRVYSINLQCGEWRKANHIHKWFVENVQDGNDDCGEYCVSIEDLKTLLLTCKKVLKNRNEEVSNELLPTAAGFFFGGTDYDEYYYETIQYTVGLIEHIQETYDPIVDSFFYRSSW